MNLSNGKSYHYENIASEKRSSESTNSPQKISVGAREFSWPLLVAQQKNTSAGCSKRPDFSPAQPWRAETRLVPSKAADEEQAAGVPFLTRPP